MRSIVTATIILFAFAFLQNSNTQAAGPKNVAIRNRMPVAISSDGKFVACAPNEKIKVWDRSMGALKFVFAGHSDDVNCLEFAKNGNLLYSGSLDKTVIAWDLSNGKKSFVLGGHDEPVHNLAVSYDQKLLISASNSTVRVWDLPTRKHSHVVFTRELLFSVTSVWFSHDGKKVLIAGSDAACRVLDVKTGQVLSAYQFGVNCVYQALIHEDKQILIAGHAGHGSFVELIDIKSGKTVRKIPAPDVGELALTKNSILYSTGDAKVHVWTIDGTSEVASIKINERPCIPMIAASPDCKWLVASSAFEQRIVIWDLEKKKLHVAIRAGGR